MRKRRYTGIKSVLVAGLFWFLPLLTLGQRQFFISIVEDKTGAPVDSIYCVILKNDAQYIGTTWSNAQGLCKITLPYYDSTATYQAELYLYNRVKPMRQDISTMATQVPILRVTPVPEKVRPSCPTSAYFGYYPRTPFSLDDLPADIAQKVQAHLVERVGRRFYKRMTLNGGQVVELDRLYTLVPSAKSWSVAPNPYDLCFNVLDPQNKTPLFSFNLELDERGELVKPVPLPAIRKNKSRGKVISQAEARKIALKENFFLSGEGVNTTEVKAEYRPDLDAMVWIFNVIWNTPKSGYSHTRHSLTIDAHTGKILEMKDDGVIVLED
jgi:hypothetical protein